MSDNNLLTDLNFCTNHRPCKNGGSCKNSGHGSYTCKCPPNTTGKNCEIELTTCDHEPCQNGATCRVRFNSLRFLIEGDVGEDRMDEDLGDFLFFSLEVKN